MESRILYFHVNFSRVKSFEVFLGDPKLAQTTQLKQNQLSESFQSSLGLHLMITTYFVSFFIVFSNKTKI